MAQSLFAFGAVQRVPEERLAESAAETIEQVRGEAHGLLVEDKRE